MRVALGILVCLLGSMAWGDSFKINSKTSTLGWGARKVSGEHNGTIALKNGQMTFESGKLSGGQMIFDMKSIKNLDVKSDEWRAKLEKHLKSDDFFMVKKFPITTFKILKATALKTKNSYRLDGELTIKGMTKPVTVQATASATKSKAFLKASLKINRLDWDIRYRSGKFFDVKKLGDKLIYDDISINVDLRGESKKDSKKS
jgi:polyisoprenoid-binding protein YceI